ncbi:alcohol dehydrogenase catalytic domain-containing protein [Lagierella sp.]|uniref:MDR/zinc-dependent alcohol dehydrogenase-like family protein n=1 Tax=Lagierella sp. TaxID=2849657 RepID=UPI00262B4EE5|nr:alcohol dehydrogenase catalytic domain-containing protein [Lagierella sp.]
MKALYFNKGTLEFKSDYPNPRRNDDEALIKVLYVGICNTDREILKGYRPDFKGVLGHEFVGEVVESGDSELLGKTVVGEINQGCGWCKYCTKGMEKHCINRKVLGISGHDGTFGEYLTWPNRLLHEVDKSLDKREALFTEPLAAALEICERENIKPSSKVLLIGDGRLSFMIGQVISLTGADLTVLGRHEDKLRSFKPFANVIMETDSTFPIVIDATGNPSGIKRAMELVENAGKIVVKSTYTENIELDLSEIVVREISISGSRCGPFRPALNLLKKGYVSFPEIEFYPLEEYKRAFESRSFKVGFEF